MLLMKNSVLSLIYQQHNIGFPTFIRPQVPHNLQRPNIIMIARLFVRVQLSIYSTRALLYKYFVATLKYN